MIQREILINTARLIISKLIPALLLTFINIIYSRVLNPSDYGTYQIVWTYLNVFVILTSFGLPKYIIASGNDLSGKSMKKLMRIFSLISSLVFILIGIYLFVFFKGFDLHARIFFLVLLLSQTGYIIQEAYVISDEGGKKLIATNVVYAFLLFGVHMLIYYGIGYQLSYCILGIALVSLLRNILLWNMTVKSIYVRQKDSSSIGTDYSLIFWMGLNDALQMFTKWMDKLILVFILPAAEFAIYYNGTFELPLIGMFLMAFQSIITLYSAKTRDNRNQIELFHSSSLFLSGIIFPLFAWMFWYATPIVHLLFGSRYEESGVLFALTALVLPMRICSYTVLLQIKNKGRIILTGSIIDFIFSILFMFLLYPVMETKGLIVSLILATYIQAAYYLIYTSKIYQIPFRKILPFQKLGLRLLFVFSIVAIIKYIETLFISLNSLIMGSLVFLVLVGLYMKKNISFPPNKMSRG